MARINIVNADNKIDATPQRAYFKLKQTGGPKGEKGDTGAQGPQGATGPQGASASVVVNSTTTLPAGSDATVENIGTPQNVKLNFGIPTGAQGPQGEQGPQGAQGPQGLKGDTGAKGADGAAAKVTVGNTNTGAAGTNAIVENTGSETYAVLNFTIPRGDKGETGPMPDIAQTTGQATDEVMSQKATTDALATKQNTLTAGTGITIASDTVSADTTVLATKAETDALLAPKLEADVVASLPATGEEGKLYLTPKNYTRQTATGNPITATISDRAGTLEAFQLDGDTYQQSYEGKNLLRLNDGTMTLGGVPITTTNGTVNLRGTATSYAQGYYVTIGVTASEPMVFSINRSGATSGLTIKLQYKRGEATYYPTINDTWRFEAGDIIQQLYLIIANGSIFDGSFSPMLEVGSTATSFEPFVGGKPAPSPDYPQPIQTVTGEQMVTVVGKNLVGATEQSYTNQGITTTLNSDGTITCKGTCSQTYFQITRQTAGGGIAEATPCNIPAGTYTLSLTNTTSQFGVTLRLYASTTATDYKQVIVTKGNSSDTITLTSPAVMFYIWGSSTTVGQDIDETIGIQFEPGSAATSFVPFSKQTYPLDLGSIELCKLDTYQDYIYKDGNDWKVHKATAHETRSIDINGIRGTGSGQGTPSEAGAFSILGGSPYWVNYVSQLGRARASENLGEYLAQSSVTSNAAASSMEDGTFCQRAGTNDRVYFRNTALIGKTGNEVKALMLAKSGGTNAWWTLGTPTDTTITNSTLIAQLEAIRTAALETSTNTIANSTAGANLAGDMEITYYGYNPTNRYDKFIWLDLNDNYEQIGE